MDDLELLGYTNEISQPWKQEKLEEMEANKCHTQGVTTITSVGVPRSSKTTSIKDHTLDVEPTTNLAV